MMSTGSLCLYATDPHARPHCTLGAAVRLGSVLLCPSCAARRSTLGKGTAPQPLIPARAVHPLDWVSATHQEVHDAERALDAAVHRARQHGHSWALIADRLGITRQGAQQRFRDPPNRRPT